MYHIFVDGSATDQVKTFHNKECRKAGIGIYHPESDTQISEQFTLPNPTNNRAELYACIRALEWVRDENKDIESKKIKIILYCDSQLVINSMTKWIYNWKRNGWKKANNKPILNVELIIKLYSLITNYFPLTTFVKVKAHTKKPDDPKKQYIWKGNYIADKLAFQGRCL